MASSCILLIIIFIFTAVRTDELIQKSGNLENLTKRGGNSSRIVARHLYLPPEVPDFTLPEVIDNRVRNIFLRPLATHPIIVPPSIDLRTPFASENYRYLPPATKQTTVTTAANSQVHNNDDDTTGFVTVNSMSCRNNDDEIFFRATIIPTRKSGYPVIEAATGDSKCKITKINDEFKLDLNSDLFWNCGVQDCTTEVGRFYCLNLRFPAVSGLRLKEDIKILLRCRTQEKTTSHTKRINLKTLNT